MVSYKDNDPRGWCGDPSRGAALGRREQHGERQYFGKLRLCRAYLNNGGYDANGTYFGSGAPLYWYASPDGDIDGVTRAKDRDAAKQIVLQQYPNATFYR